MNKLRANDENVWKDYIRRDDIQVNDEELENDLLQDDESLAAYIEALTSLEQELPKLADQDRFTEKVMRSIPIAEQKYHTKSTWSRNWSRHPLFHYVIAASITLFLMSCGLFDYITLGTEKVIHQTEGQSLSQQLLDKTSSWIDKIKP
ncbi:hypothetical protein [Paenibacillus segetis]|uniref:Uncharacterized protein n=1 Tax=Paenibacillus segetis TaxID=1325360 RepID=A0ABQ1YFD3_9BACL|nr:hypothetical protein [Paenibacillus segetis]GGH24087.1 hypothetical protein GCM10008013_23630 [Paenibacillus segetis]